MAIRAKKIQPYQTEAVETMTARIKESQDFVFTDYRGMTVEQITSLRRQLREKNASYHVIKNNYAKIAFINEQYPDVSDLLVGPTAIAFTSTEANEIAKIIADFGKESPVKLKGALVEKEYLDEAAIVALSKLPGRNQLIAMFMAALKSPIQKLVYTLVALQEKGGAGEPAAEAAPAAPAVEAAPAAPASETEEKSES